MLLSPHDNLDVKLHFSMDANGLWTQQITNKCKNRINSIRTADLTYMCSNDWGSLTFRTEITLLLFLNSDCDIIIVWQYNRKRWAFQYNSRWRISKPLLIRMRKFDILFLDTDFVLKLYRRMIHFLLSHISK